MSKWLFPLVCAVLAAILAYDLRKSSRENIINAEGFVADRRFQSPKWKAIFGLKVFWTIGAFVLLVVATVQTLNGSEL